MKKALKWILIGLGGIVGLFIAAMIYLSVSGKGVKMIETQKSKSLRAYGKILANSVTTQIMVHQIDTEKFSDITKIRASFVEDRLDQTMGPYSFGVASESEMIKALCPDCTISDTTFKVAVFGNIDEDEDLDVITIDQDQKMMLIQDDIGEEEKPVDINPKGDA